MHDLAASPRRALAAPPKSHPKKIGAPKAKGAVRAKSGCYTCRIRRKKCDEQPNDEGRCQTCCRLRLQCLGFGQKRPDWLKNNNVTVFREKIKDFLAAQGMIKGHSGSGTRASDQEGMLVLVSESGRSDASSPHSPTLSASSSEDHRPRGLAVSDERTSQYPIMPMHHTQYSTSAYPPIAADFPESREHMLPSTTELSLPFVAPPPSTIMPSNNSLASMSSWSSNPSPASYPTPSSTSASSYHHQQLAQQPPHQHHPQHSPQALTHVGAAGTMMPFISSLSDAYRTPYVFDPEEYPPEPVSPGYYIPQGMDTPILPYIPQSQSALVKHYLDHVLMRQYLLADSSISEFIIRTIQKSAAVRDAVCLLSALHRASLVNSGAVESASALTPASSESDYVQIYRRIHHTLVPAAGRADYSEDEALTGLLVVSAFLFRGGRGQWLQFLTVAAEWVGGLLAGYTDPDGAAALLLRCTDSQRFIIKTTFWFDILASATRREPPLFLPWYRRLWGAPRARIDVLDGAAGPHASADEQKLSMMTVMGCENATALAIAETSDLAHWKATHAAAGTLSVPDLVDRGRTIEGTLLPAPSPPSPQPPYGVFDGYDGFGGDDDIGRRRRYTADIFRGAAKIYLHSVLSGEHPLNPEIRDGVAAVVATLRKLPPVQPGGSPTHANAHLHGGGAAGSGAYASSASSSSTYGASPTYGSAGSSFGSASSSSTYGPSSSSSTYGPSSSSSAYGPSAAAGFPFSAPPAGSKPASLASSVLRSAVFGITLAGCLTDDYASRVYILARLRGEEREEGVGNCAEARKVMEYVWDARARGVEGGWREAMQKVGLGAGELLLV